MAEILANWRQDDSLTVAISGEWGSGKTSVKNMLVEHLKSLGDKAPLVLEFTPWKWASQEKIAEGFFREVAVALDKADPTTEGRNRVRKWKRYGRLLRFGSEAATGFNKLLGVALGIAGIATLASGYPLAA